MKWVNLRNAGWSALVLAGAMGLSACTDANEALTIVQAQVPGDNCAIDEEGSGGTRLPSGILDVGLDQPYGYRLYPLLSNNLAPLATGTGIEPNQIDVTGVEVEIVPPSGLKVDWPAGCAAEFSDYSNANIPPGGGRRALNVQAIHSCHAATIRDLFLAGKLNMSVAEEIKFRVVVRAKGRHGGTDIKSDPFEFPIRLCYGCLQVGFQGDYAQFSFETNPRHYLACDKMAENPYKGNACNKAQDTGPILCCADGPALVCPGVSTAKSTGTGSGGSSGSGDTP